MKKIDNLTLKIRNINKTDKWKYEYAFCTLVTSEQEYAEMLASLEKKDFTNENSEFLYIDNINVNTYDAYSGLNKMLSLSNAKYVILCHQDIRFDFDNIDTLKNRILEISKLDPLWGVLGNAGGTKDFSKTHIRITDPHGENQKTSNFPMRVESLDENFLLIKNGLNIGFSNDLDGFHMYGTDLCLHAQMSGNTCYVVDFHVRHLGTGKRDNSFFISKNNLIDKYRKIQQDKVIKTTCTTIYVSKFSILNRLLNIERITRLKKYLDRVFYA